MVWNIWIIFPYFPYILGIIIIIIIPTDEVIFFRGVAQPPTSNGLNIDVWFPFMESSSLNAIDFHVTKPMDLTDVLRIWNVHKGNHPRPNYSDWWNLLIYSNLPRCEWWRQQLLFQIFTTRVTMEVWCRSAWDGLGPLGSRFAERRWRHRSSSGAGVAKWKSMCHCDSLLVSLW